MNNPKREVLYSASRDKHGTDHKQVLQALSNLNIGIFAKPIRWYTGGKSSTLHSLQQCRALKDIALTTGVTKSHRLTLKQAIRRQICGECCYRGTVVAGVRKNILWAATVLTIVENELHAETPTKKRATRTYRPKPGPNLVALRRNQRRESMLSRIAEIDVNETAITSWKSRLQDEIRSTRLVPINQKRLAKEILYFAAANIHIDEMIDFKNDAHNGTIAYIEESARRAVVKLVEHRLSLLSAGISPAKIKQALHGDKVRHLQGNRTLLKRLLTDWAKQMSALVADAEPVLLCVGDVSLIEPSEYYADQNDADVILFNSLDWIKEAGKGAVFCHPTIGAFIAGEINGTSTVALTEIPTNEMMQDALRLWDQDDEDSVYHTVGEALKAAKLL